MRQHAVFHPAGAARMLTHGGSVASCAAGLHLRADYGPADYESVLTITRARVLRTGIVRLWHGVERH